MVGMTMAIALAHEGLRVAVIEKGAMPAQLEANYDGRSSAIALGSQRLLDSIGAWDSMAAYAEPIRDIRVSDGKEPFFLHYDHREVGNDPFGYIVENRYIRHALHQAALTHPTLTIFEHTTCNGYAVDAAGVTLHLKEQDSIRCRLAIAAEGRNSPLREMAGIKTIGWNYKQTAIVCTIAHELPHHGLAQERFLPAGPFAVLPMTRLRQDSGAAGSYRSSLVWVEPNDRVDIYMELPEEEFVQEITERVGDYLGTISLAGARFSYPLSLLHAKQYTAQRLALIGDAAHGMHPIAGQGVNVGFRDVGALAELIVKQHKLGLDIGSDEVLAHYQRWRSFDNVSMLAVTDGLVRLFEMQAPPVRIARDLGMWTVGKILPLKRFLMRHAMGLVGDLPESVKKKTGS